MKCDFNQTKFSFQYSHPGSRSKIMTSSSSNIINNREKSIAKEKQKCVSCNNSQDVQLLILYRQLKFIASYFYIIFAYVNMAGLTNKVRNH